ncbi:TRAM [Heterostelium album PN500]|uniref:TRAM n=1 Tax=Heterostelium pallidum (strain ATCC 26659 / Pp 5 / PN500) TaxID=670386 RepID=D3B9S9_HETP5|nr:TRAM [Heterostelium album PN500]EFA81991.1 TRAM [Heterostelium album PN500]|eukprot:XP_020434108.1 TRAM [Heterostelium album PN500]
MEELINTWNVEILTALMFTLTLYVSNVITPLFYKDFHKLEKKDKIEWNSRIGSNINAIVCTYGALKCLFFENLAWTENPYYDISPSSSFYMRFILGYFFYDTIILLINHSQIDSATLMHHLMGLLLYYLGISRKYCHFVLVSYMLTEVSTPFVNFRWFLYRTNKSKDFIYIINGLLMALGFLLARVLYAPTTIGYALITKYPLSLNLPGYIWWGTYLGCVAINSLNMYWAYLIFRGLYRAMKKPPTTTTTTISSETTLQQPPQEKSYQSCSSSSSAVHAHAASTNYNDNNTNLINNIHTYNSFANNSTSNLHQFDSDNHLKNDDSILINNQIIKKIKTN